MTQIKLTFELTIEAELENIDELGEAIAIDLLQEMVNGEDPIHWEYITHKVIR